MLDLAIVGAGPAALSAAIYAARAGLKVRVFEKGSMGGALARIARIENYPGFMGAGLELADKLKAQAAEFGAEFEYGECQKVESGSLVIDGEKVSARAILIATGSGPKSLKIEGITKPISYCAICDGALYGGKRLAVVGSGNSAFQEATHLAEIAESVTIFAHAKVKAESYLIKNLPDNITIKEDNDLTAAELNQFDGIFVFIGKSPATDFLDKALLTNDGYIKTNNYMTSVTGVFAAGDVRDGSVQQVVTAAADGASAALRIVDFLRKK